MTTTAAGWARRATAIALTLFAAALSSILPAGAAWAHPLDITWQTSYVTLSPGRVGVEVKISVGALVAPEFLADLDRDGDGTFSAGEGNGYASRVLARVAVRIDGAGVPLALDGVELPDYRVTRAGYGVLRIRASGPAPAGGRHEIFYRDDFVPEKPRYQIAVAAAKGAEVAVGVQHRDDAQRQVETDFTIGARASTEAAPAETTTGGWGVDRLLATMRDPSRSLWVTAVAIALAMALGAFHALTPGHGKTLMAAHLVGTGGRVRDALALGASLTATHTASVIVIGVIALIASHSVVPRVLVPTLEVASGALVLILGLRLLWQRRDALPWTRRIVSPVHHHGHHPDGHGHHPDGHGHHPDGHGHHPDGHGHRDGHGAEHGHHEHGHSHGLRWEPGRPLSLAAVMALGASGGLVPCPEALGVMILAVGLGQIPIGLTLILSFSVGLAAVLIGIGVLLVRVRQAAAVSGRLSQRAAARWLKPLPLASALVVVVLGAGLIARSITDLT